MKLVTIRNSRMLAGIANMLECHGFETDDRSIALGMEAPYLFLRENGCFVAGASLFVPRYINLYLHSIGFHLERIALPKDEVLPFLRNSRTALLPLLNLKETPPTLKPVVFSGIQRGRFIFTNLKPEYAKEPDSFSYTTPMLLSRLTDSVKIYTLTPIPPEPADFLPYLAESLRNIATFGADFQEIAQRRVTREEYEQLKKTHLHALMHDLEPMAAIGHDSQLYNELKLLNHLHSYVFLRFSPERVSLKPKLPMRYVQNAVTWLQEDIIDRLYAHGASDDFINKCKYGK